MELLIIPYAIKGILETFKIIISVISLIMYLFDFSSDNVTYILHFLSGDIIWANATIICILIPVYIGGLLLLVMLKDHKVCNRQLHLGLRLLIWIITAPVAPLLLLIWDLVINCRRQTFGTRWEAAMMFLKFIDAFAESYPQGTLQLYIVFQALAVGEAIGAFQWVTISFSFLALAFGISTNSMFEKAAGSSQAAFFFVGLLGTISRMVVCCSYSMMGPEYLFLTLGAGWIASVVVTNIIKFCCKSNQESSNEDVICFNYVGFSLLPALYDSFTIGGFFASSINLGLSIGNYFPFSLLPALYDSFTIGGFFSSSINLGLSIGSFFLPIPVEISIVAVTLSTLTAIANMAIIAIPPFKTIGMDWEAGIVNLANSARKFREES